MIFLVCLIFGGLLLIWLLEELSLEEELKIRQLIKQSRKNERKRAWHRGIAYTQCG